MANNKQNIETIEKKLWRAADQLRANSALCHYRCFVSHLSRFTPVY